MGLPYRDMRGQYQGREIGGAGGKKGGDGREEKGLGKVVQEFCKKKGQGVQVRKIESGDRRTFNISLFTISFKYMSQVSRLGHM